MLRTTCPCDLDGFCPYDSFNLETCEYWCGLELETGEEYEDWQELPNDPS